MSSRRRITSEQPEEQAITLEDPYHLKYRPALLTEVVGQDDVIKSLTKVTASKNPGHAYLFTGPAGTGKTTLARVLAIRFMCGPSNVLEVDAASNSGIDDMRKVTETLRYQGFGESPNRAIIIDECHRLSKNAWDSLLKSIEEPPAHVFFFFCTTEPGKIPTTVASRLHSYTLKSIRFDDIMDVLETVCHLEKLPTTRAVLELIAKECGGSLRTALVYLSMARDCVDPSEVGTLLEAPSESKEVIDLCRLLARDELTWPRAVAILSAIPDLNPESVRIVVTNYLAKVLMGATEKTAPKFLFMLDQFAQPFNTTDKAAPLLLALGKIIYN